MRPHPAAATVIVAVDLISHRALTAVVVPSRAEPFGRIPLEAFAVGACPVIATTAGGLAELVTESKTGYTGRPGDPRSLAVALRHALAATPADRAQMRAEARQLAATRYDYEKTVRSFLHNVAAWATAPPMQTCSRTEPMHL